MCQLARQEKTSGYRRFVRNGTPDGGVECFWKLEDGREIAWQGEIDRRLAEHIQKFLLELGQGFTLVGKTD